jgi:hypothetical protein
VVQTGTVKTTRFAAASLLTILVLAACTDTSEPAGSASSVVFDVPSGDTSKDFGPAPVSPDGDLKPDVVAALDSFFGPSLTDGVLVQAELEELQKIEGAGDPRLAWIISDLLRITTPGELRDRLVTASDRATGTKIDPTNPWGDLVDKLMTWDTPAPPDYLKYKRSIYTLVEPGWEDLFADNSDVDWRHVSWGGVRIDDRPFDTTDEPCNCIPAADNPEVASADDTTWLDDEDVIFGVEINGESRAYPRQIMEVREMVNDTLGGRDIGMPYCTLCGSAQVYFTDEVPDGVERPVLRTSGLLIRSNKVMYEINTKSVFDTFTGAAVSGELLDKGIVLPQASVVTTTWGQWKSDHPDTTALVESLALGRDFDFRNGRDADGPIFPIGDVDPRLPVQEDIVGVIAPDGTPVAFHLVSAMIALEAGQDVEVNGIELVLDGGGVRAVDNDGNDLGSHQAFWFAWSQFHTDTEVWPIG